MLCSCLPMTSIRALVLQLVSSASVLGACSSGVSRDGMTSLACADNDQTIPRLTQDIAGQTPYDFLELGGQRIGEACKTATNRATCLARVDEARDQTGSAFTLGDCQWCLSSPLFFTHGDQVRSFQSANDVREWLAPIESPTEAALTVLAYGYDVPCGEPAVETTTAGFEVVGRKLTQSCAPIEETEFRLAVDREGRVRELESSVIDRDNNACIGRRPEGLVARGRSCDLGSYLADIAQLEAASVHAFVVLERELRHHGAPLHLQRRARAAAKDEIRHARLMRALAERHGGGYRAPLIQRQPLRSLEAMARDNATEGCVRETFGALIGAWQARHAPDAELRALMAGIADDEIGHAQLSWDLHAWFMDRLDEDARARVRAAHQRAAAELHRRAPAEVAAFAPALGLPSAQESHWLAHHFLEALAA